MQRPEAPSLFVHISASRMVEEAMEVAVPDAQAAISIYTWGLGAAPAPLPQSPADGHSAAPG